MPCALKPVSVYSHRTPNIIETMRAAGGHRLVCCTSGGTNPHFDRGEGIFFGLIIKPLIGRTLYADMRRMEEMVMASGLDWTIAGPAQLVGAPAVSAYRVAEAHMVPGMAKTARVDLADFMRTEAVRPRHVRQAVAVATRSAGLVIQ